MINTIKSIISNRDCCTKYLGVPNRIDKIGNWYLSPFNREKTASFLVSDKGIHDFSTNKHYDIISLVENLYKINFKSAIEVLSRDFNIPIKEKKLNKEEIQRIKQERDNQKKLNEEIELYYLRNFTKLVEELHTNLKIIEICKRNNFFEALEILYKENVLIEIEMEYILHFKDKKDYYIERRKNGKIL
jgi:DNA primase